MRTQENILIFLPGINDLQEFRFDPFEKFNTKDRDKPLENHNRQMGKYNKFGHGGEVLSCEDEVQGEHQTAKENGPKTT